MESTGIDRLLILLESNLSNKTVTVSVLLYGCTSWTLMKCMEKI